MSFVQIPRKFSSATCIGFETAAAHRTDAISLRDFNQQRRLAPDNLPQRDSQTIEEGVVNSKCHVKPTDLLFLAKRSGQVNAKSLSLQLATRDALVCPIRLIVVFEMDAPILEVAFRVARESQVVRLTCRIAPREPTNQGVLVGLEAKLCRVEC